MAVFELRTLDMPLFGVVELKNREKMRKQFSKGGATLRIEIDDSTYELLARELRLEARDLVSLAHRYADGDFFAGAAGLGGTCLGDFGELLAFLVNRAARREIVRVFSYAAMGTPLKGNKFPQPDFLVEAGPKQFALEVKSTEAFDLLDLGNISTWRGVHACRGLPEMRTAALRQLGYLGATRTKQAHHLKLESGKTVPFPATDGQAVAVLVQDGRVRALRSDDRYKAPARCRNATTQRSCWSCVPPGQAAVLVTMSNEPGRLALVGGHREGWLAAYKRWTGALLAAEPMMIRAAGDELTTATAEWLLNAVPEELRPDLAIYWARYLVDSNALHGVRTTLPRAFFPDPDVDLEPLEGVTLDAPEPTEEVSWNAARQAVRGNRGTPLHVSAGATGDAQWRLSAHRSQGGWRFTLGAEEWWERRFVGDRDARRLGLRLINKVLDLFGWPSVPEEAGQPDIRRLSASVGDEEVFCGWELKTWASEKVSTAGRRFLQWISWTYFEPPFARPGWLHLLATGDPRVRLYVHPDGRADLSIAHPAPAGQIELR